MLIGNCKCVVEWKRRREGVGNWSDKCDEAWSEGWTRGLWVA